MKAIRYSELVTDGGIGAIEDAVDKEILKKQIEDVLDTLSPREEYILEQRFGLKDGCYRLRDELGKEFNVTRERIRQIEAKALCKLRNPEYRQKLVAFL